MAEHGGYRRPTNPAKVSGPGKLARRTDGQPTMDLNDAQYGENKQFRELQQGAKLATDNTGAGPAPSAGGGLDLSQITGLGEPSTQPGTPVTDGAEYGDGAGMDALGLPQDIEQQDAQHLAKYLPTLIRIAESDETPPGTRRFIRALIARS